MVGDIKSESPGDFMSKSVGDCVGIGTSARYRHQNRHGAFLQRQFDDVDGIVDGVDRSAEIDAADNGKSATQRLAKESRSEGDQHPDTSPAAGVRSGNAVGSGPADFWGRRPAVTTQQ